MSLLFDSRVGDTAMRVPTLFFAAWHGRDRFQMILMTEAIGPFVLYGRHVHPFTIG